MNAEELIKRRLATAENIAVRQRNYRRARDRALAKLAQNHKGEYLELLAKEKEADEQEGKRWHNLAGVSLPGKSNNSADHANKNRRNTSINSQDESDNE